MLGGLPRGVGGEDDHAGVGEVGDLHHPVHQGQADGDDGEERAEEHAVDEDLTHGGQAGDQTLAQGSSRSWASTTAPSLTS